MQALAGWESAGRLERRCRPAASGREAGLTALVTGGQVTEGGRRRCPPSGPAPPCPRQSRKVRLLQARGRVWANAGWWGSAVRPAPWAREGDWRRSPSGRQRAEPGVPPRESGSGSKPASGSEALGEVHDPGLSEKRLKEHLVLRTLAECAGREDGGSAPPGLGLPSWELGGGLCPSLRGHLDPAWPFPDPLVWKRSPAPYLWESLTG